MKQYAWFNPTFDNITRLLIRQTVRFLILLYYLWYYTIVYCFYLSMSLQKHLTLSAIGVNVHIEDTRHQVQHTHSGVSNIWNTKKVDEA